MDFQIKNIPIKKYLNKPMLIMLASLGGFLALVLIYKITMGFLAMKYMSGFQPIITVTAMQADYQEWQPKLKASGSTRAKLGVDVTSSLGGIVKTIHFTPGAEVQQNDLLVELNTTTEKAQLASLEAALELSKITYERNKLQLKARAISQSAMDEATTNLKSAEAQVEQQRSIVEKKLIKAPFAGKLGVTLINPGQYINPGDRMVTLQALDPLFVDFFIPQQSLKDIVLGKLAQVNIDTYPGRIFTGKVTTINPKVDPKTRNVQIEATIDNPEHLLLPGMFVSVEVDTGQAKQYLTLPQTAITYNPYGNIVYIVKETQDEKTKKTVSSVVQTFVEIGETRGNQVAILKGVQKGDWVVTSGQLKLKNGSLVRINNTVTPNFEKNPVPAEEK